MRIVQIIFAWFFIVMISISSHADAKDAKPVFRALTAQEHKALVQERGLVAQVLATRYGVAGLTGTRTDFPHLQRLINEQVIGKKRSKMALGLGVAFGDVIAKELGLNWVMVTDEFGTDPVLRYKNSSIQVSAYTMIIKRLEDGRDVELQYILDEVSDRLRRLIASGDFQ